jgi:hypothetical protein
LLHDPALRRFRGLRRTREGILLALARCDQQKEKLTRGCVRRNASISAAWRPSARE